MTNLGFDFFGVTFHWFGILVGIGLFLSYVVFSKRMTASGFSEGDIDKCFAIVVIPGFLGSHIVTVLLYEPHLLRGGWLELLRFWHGMSSTGGILGAGVGLYSLARIYGRRFWTILDHTCLAFWSGWVVARLGCTIAMDHPGTVTNFFLAFEWQGQMRHNLGFYEFLYALLVILPVCLYFSRVQRAAGMQLVLSLCLFAPVRFGLDFLRVVDLRYGGLTFAQYACLVFLLFACRAYLYIKKQDVAPLKEESIRISKI